jgi:hypothetical protein
MPYQALTQRRREIAAQIRGLNTDLAHLDAVIAMFGPGERPRGRHKARLILDVLRDGGGMTAAEIAEAVGGDVKRVSASLAHQRAKGAVRSERRGKVVVWGIANS